MVESKKKKSILMVFAVAPWPARAHGVSIRYYPVLEAISPRHDIDIFVHAEYRDTVPDDPLVSSFRKVMLKRNDTRPPGLGDRFITLAEALSPFGRPHLFAGYHSGDVLRRLRDFVAGQRYDSVLWVGPRRRELLSRLIPQLGGARLVYDSVDSPYLYHSREPRPAGVRSLWRSFDLWKTRRWENSLLRGMDAAAYISVPDATAACNNGAVSPQVIPNGIYLAGEEVGAGGAGSGMTVGFLGAMDYLQNIRATLRLYEKIFTPLQKDLPDLRLAIIGRSPSPEVSALAGPGVEVTGTVESIWPHVAGVSVFVYPMIGGAGLQNKILEAMHAGKPVVTTENCLKSIGAREGREVLVGRSDEELREHTRALLMQPEYARELGMRGKAYVDRTFEVSQVVKRFQRLLIPGDEA